MASSKPPGAQAPGGAGPTSLPQESIFQQLRATPRIFGFSGALLITAISLGAKEVARWQYLRDSFDSEWGIGVAAAVAAITLALSGFLLGRVIDRRDPRPFVILALIVGATGNIVVGVSLLEGPLPTWLILIAAVFDGATLGIGGVALLKTQAAFVNPGAEGAAEILNILRLGIGGVVGALLAGISPSPSTTYLVGTFFLIIGVIGSWIAMRPITPRMPTRQGPATATSLWSYLRSAHSIRRTITIDLILALVIPTQLVNLALFNLDIPQLASQSIAGGLAGVLVGRLALTLIGFRGNPRVILLSTIGGLSAVQLVSAVTLTDGWLLAQAILLPLVVIIGTGFSTYAQGLLAAIIQQQVVEDHRGGVSAVLVVGRNVLISIGALLGTLVTATLGAQASLAVLGCALIAVILATRGFSVIPRS